MTSIIRKKAASAPQIASFVAGHLARALAASSGEIAICVPGGSTPFPIFKALVKADLDWNRIEIWPGDDRIVAEDHPASNIGKIRAIFEPAGARIAALDESFQKNAQPPRFAICWLGMGADGHIASLFPNTDPQVDAPETIVRLTPDPLPPEAPFDRITLTLPALLNSQLIMFTLGGSEAKRALFDAAIEGERDLPVARLIRAASQNIICFI